MSTSQEIVSALEQLHEARSVLDAMLGDSDISHFENDQEQLAADPAGWALMRLSSAIETLQAANTKATTARRKVSRRKCKCPCHSTKRLAGSRFYHAFPCCDDAADFPAPPEEPCSKLS